MAGIGKTALILHWAHRARERFPNGQLYADLRGYSADTQAKPSEVLARFLRACEVPADRVPLDADEAEAAYRSLLADRRMLVVLDNASCASQVRPLLPGGRNCAVAVTSRDRLDGLAARDGARRIDLGVLRLDEVATLLMPVLGAERIGAEIGGRRSRRLVRAPAAGAADRGRDDRRRALRHDQRLRRSGSAQVIG